MRYLVNTPWWLRTFFPKYVWQIPSREKVIYLTFDDGPHEQATVFVLDQLKKYNAKASFFCIGKNVMQHPGIYQRILDEGHTVGNHTAHHLNGWKTNDDAYLKDIREASNYINSPLFRPPYGRIRRSQFRQLSNAMKVPSARVIMWSVLSGDFDEACSKEQCLKNVQRNIRPGAILLFHDSEKAFSKMSYALPVLMEELTEKGYRFAKLD